MQFWLAADGYPYAGDRQGDDPPLPTRPTGAIWDPTQRDWVIAVAPFAIFSGIEGVFQRAIAEQSAVATPAVQKDLLKLSGVVERALTLGLFAAAREAILEPALNPALEPYRTAMLNLIPE